MILPLVFDDHTSDISLILLASSLINNNVKGIALFDDWLMAMELKDAILSPSDALVILGNITDSFDAL